MPRAVIAPGTTCVECLNGLGAHQGHPHPRTYQFPANTVATALAAMGHGDTYRDAGEKARAATRVRKVPRPVRAKTPWRQSGNLVMDWVEIFAGQLWERFGPTSWPDVIAVDELIVSGPALSSSARARQMWPQSSMPTPPAVGNPAGQSASGKGGRRLFTILGATGYLGRAAGRPWLLQAVPSATVGTWVEFFSALPGIPSVVVGDAGHAWQQAIQLAWPAPGTPEIVISEFHLRQMLDRHLDRMRIPKMNPIRDLARDAFLGPTEWAALTAALDPMAVRDASLRKWLRRWDARIAAQLTRHAFRWTTRSTGGIEQHLKVVYRRIESRRHMFSNRERLNRLLALIALDMRDSANPRTWATTIRSWLLVRNGQPPPARQITDRVGGPRRTSSLRLGGAPT
jgi:hypothetical protein